MQVWKTGSHSVGMQEKNIYTAPILVTKLMDFFYNKSYGEDVEKILYRVFCLKEGYNGKTLYYGKKRMIIDCAVIEDYNSALKMSYKEYGEYTSDLIVQRTSEFSKLNLPGFNNESYIKDLISFFNDNPFI
jgi:hypothetical protein